MDRHGAVRRRRPHFVQNIGDGTFHHSGSLAVRAAVAAGANITYKLLYNGAVAMTGGQDAVGAAAVPALTASCCGRGRRADHRHHRGPDAVPRRRGSPSGVDVWDRDALDEAQRELAATPGVTVLIHDQECAAEKRRKRKRGTLRRPDARAS